MSDHFTISGGVISPNPWMQHRTVATGAAVSVSRSYAPSGGGNKDDLVQSVTVKWTNNTPETQWVEGMVTRGGHQVSLQARSRGFLADFHAVLVTATATPKPVDADYDLIEVSRSGVGMDAGKGGSLATGSGFCVAEKREPSGTAPFMPHSPGMFRVEAGKTIWARVDVRFRTEFWENTTIDGGQSSTESGFISGDTRVDLYATPAITDPGPRPTPTVVAVRSGMNITDDVEVPVPPGTAAGDIILAVAVNQLGAMSALVPVESGWSQLTARDGGQGDVHLRVLARLAGSSEPAKYKFGNSFLAEAIVHLITVRDVSPMLDDGWYQATELRKRWWDRDDEQVAPSINRAGQLLLCVSYLAHAPAQSPITQTPPTGMTQLSQVTGAGSTINIAVLPNPPRPTGARTFKASKMPRRTGHAITASLLLPGTKPV